MRAGRSATRSGFKTDAQSFLAAGLERHRGRAGCQRFAPGPPLYRQPPPLSPAPVGTVQTGQLPPPGQDVFPEAPQTAGPTPDELQALAANAQSVAPGSLVGRWTMSTGGTSCDVFLSLTPRTNGYIAASRGCTDQAALLSSWEVQDKEVLLSDSSGYTFARFYKTGETRFEGTTTAGQAASLNR